jgi:hypothetical protein
MIIYKYLEDEWQKYEDDNRHTEWTLNVQDVLCSRTEYIFEYMFRHHYDDLKNIQPQMSGGMEAYFDGYEQN